MEQYASENCDEMMMMVAGILEQQRKNNPKAVPFLISFIRNKKGC